MSHLSLIKLIKSTVSIDQQKAVEYSSVCLHHQHSYLVISKFDTNIQILLPVLTLEAHLSAWLVSELHLGK